MNIDELRADLLKPKFKPSLSSVKPSLVGTVVAALETRDSGILANVLNTTPNDKLKKALTDSKVLAALVDNYTKDSHTQLVQKGFDLCFFSEKLLFTYVDIKGWNNLLSNTPKTKAFNKWLHDLFQETLDYEFQKRYPMFKKNTAEFRLMFRQYDSVLHDKALKVFFDNSEGVAGLMPQDQTQLNNCSEQEWAWLKIIDKKSWFDGFQPVFYIEQTNLNVFLNFFGELDLAKQALDDIYVQAQNTKKRCMDLLNGGEKDIRKSVLWARLNDSEKNAFYKELNRISKPLQQLGLNEKEILLYGDIAPKFVKTIAEKLPATQRDCLSYLNSNNLVVTQSLSLVHFLLGTAGVETLANLSKSKKACEKVPEALSDPMTLRCFAGATYIFHYKEIFKFFPQLATWRDQHNNTLLHYALALNKNSDPEYSANCVMEIIVSNPQLRASNRSGVSLRDMCHMADAKLLANYDKKSMTTAIKSAGLNGNKVKPLKRKI